MQLELWFPPATGEAVREELAASLGKTSSLARVIGAALIDDLRDLFGGRWSLLQELRVQEVDRNF